MQKEENAEDRLLHEHIDITGEHAQLWLVSGTTWVQERGGSGVVSRETVIVQEKSTQ